MGTAHSRTMSFLIDGFLIAGPQSTPHYNLNNSPNRRDTGASEESSSDASTSDSFSSLSDLDHATRRHAVALEQTPLSARSSAMLISPYGTSPFHQRHSINISSKKWQNYREGSPSAAEQQLELSPPYTTKEPNSSETGRPTSMNSPLTYLDSYESPHGMSLKTHTYPSLLQLLHSLQLQEDDFRGSGGSKRQSTSSVSSQHHNKRNSVSSQHEEDEKSNPLKMQIKNVVFFSLILTDYKAKSYASVLRFQLLDSNSKNEPQYCYFVLISKYRCYRYWKEIMKGFYEQLRKYDFEEFLQSVWKEHGTFEDVLVPRLRFLYEDLFHLMHRVPAPISPGRIRITTRIGGKKYAFQQADVYDFSLDQVPLRWFFRCLDEKMIVTVLAHALLEKRIIFTSTSLAMLNYALESVQLLIFPFEWPYTISVLTPDLLDILESPVPYLLACPRCEMLIEKFRSVCRESNEEIILVDLDTNRVSSLVDPSMALPEEECQDLCFDLRKTTSSFLNHFDFVYPKKETFDQRGIQEIFAVFFARIVGSVSNHYNREHYLASRPESYQPFLSHFTQTAIFQLFQQTAKSHHFYFELANNVELAEVEDYLKQCREKSRHIDISFKCKRKSSSLPKLLHPKSGYPRNKVPRFTEKDMSDEIYEIVGKVGDLIPSRSQTGCNELYTRTLLLQVGVLSRSKERVVASLSQLNEIYNLAPQIVQAEFAVEILEQLPTNSISCVADLNSWVKEIVEEFAEFRPSLYELKRFFEDQEEHPPVRITGRQQGKLIEIPHFHDYSLQFEVDHMKVYKDELNEKEFTDLISRKMDLLKSQEVVSIIFSCLSEHRTFLSIRTCEIFMSKLRLYYSSNRRISKWLVNEEEDINDPVIASSELCNRLSSRGSTAYSGRIFLTTHFIWFGMTAFRRLTPLDSLKVFLIDQRDQKGIRIVNREGKSFEFVLQKHHKQWFVFIRSLVKAYSLQKLHPQSHMIRDAGTLICIVRTLLSMDIHPPIDTLFEELLSRF